MNTISKEQITDPDPNPEYRTLKRIRYRLDGKHVLTVWICETSNGPRMLVTCPCPSIGSKVPETLIYDLSNHLSEVN